MGDEKNPGPDDRERLREKEVTEVFQLSHSTIHRLRKAGEIEYSKVGRTPLYSVASIRAMLERKRNR